MFRKNNKQRNNLLAKVEELIKQVCSRMRELWKGELQDKQQLKR